MNDFPLASRRPVGTLVRIFYAVLLLALSSFGESVFAASNSELVSVDGQTAVAVAQVVSIEELSKLVAPIALYPDDLLAIILPASTYPLQIVQAARFLTAREQNSSLKPDENWDDSIVALLNYPEIVTLLNSDLDWTWKLGQAVISQQDDVIDAAREFRERARIAGNLESDDHQIVTQDDGGAIEIKPVDPEVIYVPYYEPERVTVYQRYPVVHYYSQPYPVYYYPYRADYSFSTGSFWGITSAFGIGWNARNLYLHRYGYDDHPYFGHRYYPPFYFRRPHLGWGGAYGRHHNRHHYAGGHWQPDREHFGARPHARPHHARPHARQQQHHGRLETANHDSPMALRSRRADIRMAIPAVRAANPTHLTRTEVRRSARRESRLREHHSSSESRDSLRHRVAQSQQRVSRHVRRAEVGRRTRTQTRTQRRDTHRSVNRSSVRDHPTVPVQARRQHHKRQAVALSSENRSTRPRGAGGRHTTNGVRVRRY